MKTYTINNNNYELIKNYRDGFDLSEVESKLTEFFIEYDYVVGDWAYGKLRLKGFYESNNKKAKDINDIKNLDSYITNYCATNCKHFILKRIKIDK